MATEPQSAYVWSWLPGATEPVVAGVLAPRPEGGIRFAYRQSYLQGAGISLYEPELPLRSGWQSPGGVELPGCIDDAAPDAWGRRVIAARLLGRGVGGEDLGTLRSLLESGSDRIGALDFQSSETAYAPRSLGEAPLNVLMEAAELVDQGALLPPALDLALLHGTSVGGARPKALLKDDSGRNLIAKFSSSTDHYKVVKGEFIAMELAHRVGLNVASVEFCEVMDRDVLLIERFDRPSGGARLGMVTAKTILGLYGWQSAPAASYEKIADQVRKRFVAADATLHELFARIVFNILTGNTDDHARNHSAFWDGANLRLTPAYDICPQPRSGGEASQAMEIASGDRRSALDVCMQNAHIYHLNQADARTVIDRQVETIISEWINVCDVAHAGEADREYFWGRQFLNRSVFEDYGTWPLIRTVAGTPTATV